jgi:hypothetical protein
MDVSIARAYTAGRIVFIFVIQQCIQPRLVPGEYEHSKSKIEALNIGFKTQNGDFPENNHNEFNYISVVYLEAI